MSQADRNPEDRSEWDFLGHDGPSAAPEGGGWDAAARELTVYQDMDRKAPILAELAPGDRVCFGAMVEKNGAIWRAVTLADGRRGHIWIHRAPPKSRGLIVALASAGVIALVAVAMLIEGWLDRSKPGPQPAPAPPTANGARPSLIDFGVATEPGDVFAGDGIVVVLVNKERDLRDVYIRSLTVYDDAGQAHEVNLIGSHELGEWKKGEAKRFPTGFASVRGVSAMGEAAGGQSIIILKEW